MLEDLIEEENRKIDLEAARKKEEVKYVAGIVESGYGQLTDILSPARKKDYGELQRYIFDKTMETVENIGSCLGDFCEPLSEEEKEEYVKRPEFRIGWTKLIKDDGTDTFPYPTHEGIEVYNKLMKIRGEMPIGGGQVKC